MKEIVNLPKALKKIEILPPVKRSDRSNGVFPTIVGRATIVTRRAGLAPLVPIEDKVRTTPSVQQAAQAYGVVEKNAPELAGRIVNILV